MLSKTLFGDFGRIDGAMNGMSLYRDRSAYMLSSEKDFPHDQDKKIAAGMAEEIHVDNW